MPWAPSSGRRCARGGCCTSESDERALLVRQWLAKADEDLLAARYLLTMPEDCPYATVCFHAQQAAEKCIKAVLTGLSIDFPRLHDLATLLALLPAATERPLTALQAETLSDYATATRYPDQGEPLSRAEAEEAVAVAVAVRDWIPAELE